MPVLGPPWKVPLEFPIFQLVSSLPVRFFGLTEIFSGRLIATLTFIASGILFYLILKKLNGEKVAKISFPIFTLTSFSMQWGSAILIDWFALLLTLIGIYFTIKFKEKKVIFNSEIFLSFLFLSTACLVKITTAIPWLISLFILIILKNKYILFKQKLIIFLTFCSSVIPFYFWNQFADTVKSKNPFTQFLVSKNLVNWNFGTLEQRFNGENYLIIFNRINDLILGNRYLFLILFIFLIFNKTFKYENTFFYLFSIIFSVGIFFNLYLVHDYYLINIYPAIIACIGIVVSNITDLIKNTIISNSLLIILIFLFISSTYFTAMGKTYLTNIKTDFGVPQSSKIILKETEPNSKIIIYGCNWDPTLLYFSERSGLMLYLGTFDFKYFNSQLILKYDYLFLCGKQDIKIFPKDINLIRKDKNLYSILK